MIFSPSPAMSGFTLFKTEQCCDDDLFSPFACMLYSPPPALWATETSKEEQATLGGEVSLLLFPPSSFFPHWQRLWVNVITNIRRGRGREYGSRFFCGELRPEEKESKKEEPQQQQAIMIHDTVDRS